MKSKILNRRISRMAGVLLLTVWAKAATAYIGCTERVTSVIMHSNGSVFFTTDHTCTAGWCMLNWSSADAINKGYAMLIAAEVQGGSVIFAWSTISSCSSVNPVYSSPDFISLSPP